MFTNNSLKVLDSHERSRAYVLGRTENKQKLRIN